MRTPVFLWSCVAISALLLAPIPAEATLLSGTGVLVSPTFLAEVGDDILVFFSNTGKRAVRIEVLLLRADDFSVIFKSQMIDVPPFTTTSEVFIPDDFPVLVIVRYRAAGRTSARVSLQVKDPNGETQIFTDGFESGDTTSGQS